MNREPPSERFLARLNAAGDTDITAVVTCASEERAHAVRAAVVALAGAEPHVTAGSYARSREPSRRWYRRLGSFGEVGAATRVGPVDVSGAAARDGTVVVRWSHLAGDAWSFQEFLTEALGHGPGSPTAAGICECAQDRAPSGRPFIPADAWAELTRQGIPFRATSRAAHAAIAPLVRRRPPALDGTNSQRDAASRAAPGGQDREALAVLHVPLPVAGTAAQPVSQFSRVAGLVARLASSTRSGAVAIGVTVDLRRHEDLGSVRGPGNLSLIGIVNVADDCPAQEQVEGGIRRLLRDRFWLQQLATDAWLLRAPGRVVDGVNAIVVASLAERVPITVTELWRDSGASCRQCHRPRRSLPPGLTVTMIPPALPPAGLTAGISRSPGGLVVVLRRLTPPRGAAAPWLQASLDAGTSSMSAAGVLSATVGSMDQQLLS